MKAVLVQAALPQYAPVTNHYKCDDGHHLLVTVNQLDAVECLRAVGLLDGLPVPEVNIRRSHLRGQPTHVFLADETARVIDADGDPSNGMTPLATYPAGTSFDEALAALGYAVDGETGVE